MKIIKWRIIPIPFLSVLLIALLFSFCKKEEPTGEDTIPAPALVLSDDHIEIIDEIPTTLFLSTQPGSVLDWSVEFEEEWLIIEPSSGKIDNDIIEIIVQADTSKLTESYIHAEVEFKGQQTYKIADLFIQFKRSQEVNGIEVSDEEIIIDYEVDTSSFFISNTGTSELSWDISDIPDYLILSESSGILEGGEETKIMISADREGLNTIDYFSYLKINSNVSESIIVSVILKNYNDQLDILPYLITDAIYVQSKDKIAIICSDPNQLLLLDPETLTMESLDLANGNISFSVEPEGNYAAIGYPDKFLLINLNSLTVENEYTVELELYSVLFRNENWAYVFSSEVLYANSYTHVQSVNLTSGEITQNYNWVYTNQKGQVHASDDYIYAKGASRFYKYDITSDTASRLYYKSGGSYVNQFWLTDEGDRMFLDNGNVLRLSENEEEDLVYGGSLGEDIELVGFDQASSQNLIFCLNKDTEIDSYDICTNLRTYTLDFIDLTDEIKLPSYFVPSSPTGGEVFQPDGKFVFVNSTEDKAFVLQRAIEGYPEYYNWALATIDIN